MGDLSQHVLKQKGYKKTSRDILSGTCTICSEQDSEASSVWRNHHKVHDNKLVLSWNERQ